MPHMKKFISVAVLYGFFLITSEAIISQHGGNVGQKTTLFRKKGEIEDLMPINLKRISTERKFPIKKGQGFQQNKKNERSSGDVRHLRTTLETFMPATRVLNIEVTEPSPLQSQKLMLQARKNFKCHGLQLVKIYDDLRLEQLSNLEALLVSEKNYSSREVLKFCSFSRDFLQHYLIRKIYHTDTQDEFKTMGTPNRSISDVKKYSTFVLRAIKNCLKLRCSDQDRTNKTNFHGCQSLCQLNNCLTEFYQKEISLEKLERCLEGISIPSRVRHARYSTRCCLWQRSGILRNVSSLLKGKSRQKRFLPLTVSPTEKKSGIQDRSSYYDETSVIVIEDNSKKDKHLKVFYPFKVILAVLTYGLIGILTYAIYLMPLKGPKGMKGEKGWEGWKGYQGYPGDHGDHGERGDLGLKGYLGEPGWMGYQGRKGAKGDLGGDGMPGMKGSKGKKGGKGHKGMPGKTQKGEIGEKGFKGEEGPKGFPGFLVQTQHKKKKPYGYSRHRGEHGDHHLYKKKITHNHNHDHHHHHSHEHKRKASVGLLVNSKTAVSERKDDQERDLVVRQDQVHHVLLDEDWPGEIAPLSSGEISDLIGDQLIVGRSILTNGNESNNTRKNLHNIRNRYSYNTEYGFNATSQYSYETFTQELLSEYNRTGSSEEKML